MASPPLPDFVSSTNGGADLNTIAETSRQLSTHSTVDRRLVHRSCVSEVFITDFIQQADLSYRLAAQVPASNLYFADTSSQSPASDIRFLVEALRQASIVSISEATCDPDLALVVKSASTRLAGAGRTKRLPGELGIATSLTWTSIRRGRPRAGVCLQEVSDLHTGEVLCTQELHGMLFLREEALALREGVRGSAPPSSDQWRAATSDDPRLAGGVALSSDPRNLTLRDLEISQESARALLSPPWSNGALFDHGYDHVPMQVLLEAAFQASHAVCGGPQQWEAIESSFEGFVELDSPTTVAAHSDLAGHVQVLFRQDEQLVATVRLSREVA